MQTNIIISCLSTLLILSSFQILHSIKISMSEIILNDNIMRIRINLFSDNLSSVLSQHFKKNIYFEETETDSTIMEYLNTYIKSNFSITINNTPVSYTFKSVHIDQTATCRQLKNLCIIYESHYKNAESIKTFELTNTLLFDGISELTNVSKITLRHKETKTLTFKNHDTTAKKSIYY